MALGVMGMTVQAFESMTPSEFLVAFRGYMWMEERKQKSTAYALANIIGTCGHLKKGKKVRVENFYHPANIDPKNPFYRQLLGY